MTEERRTQVAPALADAFGVTFWVALALVAAALVPALLLPRLRENGRRENGLRQPSD